MKRIWIISSGFVVSVLSLGACANDSSQARLLNFPQPALSSQKFNKLFQGKAIEIKSKGKLRKCVDFSTEKNACTVHSISSSSKVDSKTGTCSLKVGSSEEYLALSCSNAEGAACDLTTLVANIEPTTKLKGTETIITDDNESWELKPAGSCQGVANQAKNPGTGNQAGGSGTGATGGSQAADTGGTSTSEPSSGGAQIPAVTVNKDLATQIAESFEGKRLSLKSSTGRVRLCINFSTRDGQCTGSSYSLTGTATKLTAGKCAIGIANGKVLVLGCKDASGQPCAGGSTANLAVIAVDEEIKAGQTSFQSTTNTLAEDSGCTL